MPYPSQIDREMIVARASEMVEEAGVDALTLSALAKSLQVQPPSLYRYVSGKTELLRLVSLRALESLFVELEQSRSEAKSARQQVEELLARYRWHAMKHPNLYLLMMSRPRYRPDENLLVQMVLPVQRMVASVSGEQDSLTALRGALALAHGFVMLELNEQLRRGGDLDRAFRQAVSAYFRGWEQPDRGPS